MSFSVIKTLQQRKKNITNQKLNDQKYRELFGNYDEFTNKNGFRTEDASNDLQQEAL